MTWAQYFDWFKKSLEVGLAAAVIVLIPAGIYFYYLVRRDSKTRYVTGDRTE
jgi:ABC-type Fe3+ transport system permease subunit